MSPSDEIRVLTCNVQRASVTRTRQQAVWLTNSGADVLVLTEVSSGKPGDELAQLLTNDGFEVVLPPPSATDRYRVLLACRNAQPVSVDPGIGAMAHRCVIARIRFPSQEIGVAGLYVPSRGPKERKNEDKRTFQNLVASALPNISATVGVSLPVVITGDLNVVEPNHDPHYKVFGSWEYEFYQEFGRSGFDDAFRLVEPSAREYSWFGRPAIDGKRNGYRFDHAFVSRSHRSAVTACRYDHSVRTTGLSDHSALTVTLDLVNTPR